MVELKIDDSLFRQGVRINEPPQFKGIVFTFSPKVSIKVDPETDRLMVSFDYTIHQNPNNIELFDSELRPIIGGIAVDMISKDANAFRITDS